MTNTAKDRHYLWASSQYIWAEPQPSYLENAGKRLWRSCEQLIIGVQRYLHLAIVFLIILFGYLVSASQAHAEARIKDIVNFEGVRENMLMGYGLVVGLNGTGDKLKNAAFTEQSLIAFLERQGVNTRGTQLQTKNVAAVTVTATLPPFARAGGKIDVGVSAMGDAKDLNGGTLLATPLYGADGEVYAVAQGGISIGGFKAEGNGTTITKGVPTSGFIANGGVVEREVDFALNSLPNLKLSLRNPDISTAESVMQVINAQIGPGAATVTDPGTVSLTVPAVYHNNVTQLLADIEKLPVETDQVAKIVIDEASGTIVMGENVRIDTVAVAQGNLVVKIEEQPIISQPGAFAPDSAQTVVATQTSITVDENPGHRMAVLKHGATLKDLVTGLNALGVGPRDLITILQTIKAAGALQAEIQNEINMIDASASIAAAVYSSQDSASSNVLSGLGKKTLDVDKASKDFESMFIGQMVESMFGDSEGDDAFGSKESADVYKGMMTDQLGRAIADHGGIGIASYVKQELLKLQEMGNGSTNSQNAGA